MCSNWRNATKERDDTCCSFERGRSKCRCLRKKPGRGAYVSKSEQAVDLARKKNVLGHQLDVKIPEEIYEELILLIRRESIL